MSDITIIKNEDLKEPIAARVEEIVADGETEGMVALNGMDLRIFLGREPRHTIMSYAPGELTAKCEEYVYIGSNQPL